MFIFLKGLVNKKIAFRIIMSLQGVYARWLLGSVGNHFLLLSFFLCLFHFFLFVSVIFLLSVSLIKLWSFPSFCLAKDHPSSYRYVLPWGGRHGDGRRPDPEPTVPKRLPAQPPAVMETAGPTLHTCFAGVWWEVWFRGAWEQHVQVRDRRDCVCRWQANCWQKEKKKTVLTVLLGKSS